MGSAELLDTLPLVQRLALAYSPPEAREDTLTLLALDRRLAAILRQRSEVLLAQLKLAWWRDRFREERAAWPAGEPLLARLAGWRGDLAPLAELVDGWEALLAESLRPDAMRAFAAGRAAGWAALAGELMARDHPPARRSQPSPGLAKEVTPFQPKPEPQRRPGPPGTNAHPGVEQAAREWALADLALNLGAWPEAELAREVALAEPWKPLRLPRALRPLAVLRGLSGRAVRRGSSEALDGPGAALLALRIGLTGR